MLTLLASFLLLSGCAMRACEDLCAAEADCVEASMAANDAGWSEWTGFPDREAYEDACYEVFSASRQEGGQRGELEELCADEEQALVCR